MNDMGGMKENIEWISTLASRNYLNHSTRYKVCSILYLYRYTDSKMTKHHKSMALEKIQNKD